MQLALYKGPPADKWHRLTHRLTCWFTGSPYSHVELLIDGMAYSASARDGGVRQKRIDLTTGRWDVFDLPHDPEAELDALEWFVAHYGQAYDWAGVARFVFPFSPLRNKQWFCSEACAAALGLPDPHRYSPQTLFETLVGGQHA